MRCWKLCFGEVARRVVVATGFAGIVALQSVAPVHAEDAPIVGIVDQARLVKIAGREAVLAAYRHAVARQ